MLADHLGSTQLELTAGGWPVWKGEFTPFGQELDTQYTANNYKFAGMERDAESGLDHTQFRQYTSVTNRWLSPDPYNGSYDLSNPQSFNRYSYVGNMPTGFTDPNGLFLGIPLAGGGWQAGVVAGAEVAVVAAIGYGISLGVQNIFGLFSHPQCHACDHPRPAGTGTPDYAGWDGNFGESLGLPVNGPQLGGGGVGGFFGVPSGCEFGPCGNSFSPQDPNNSKSNGISGVINFNVGWHAFWGGFSHSAGCLFVGAGSGATSFFGLPATVDNGPPSAAAAVVATKDAYKVGAPALMYKLSKLGPGGRALGDLIPGVGDALIYAQTTLAVRDGGKAFSDCVSKVTH